MEKAKFDDSVGIAEETLKHVLGDDFRALGIVSGTGWNQGISCVFRERAHVDYGALKIPGADSSVSGHSKKLTVGDVDGRNVLVLGRVHPNENVTDPDVRQAMAILIAALSKCLDGLIVTNAVGTLHGRVGADQGLVKSLVRTAILDLLGWAHRGRRQERIEVGDIALVDDVKTSLVGSTTPLGAADFVDFYHKGLHRDNDKFFNIARAAIEKVQGRCPRAQSRFILGPQFEGPADKIEFRGKGDDVIGMSGIGEILECTKRGVPVAQVVFATNGPFGTHSHLDNLAVAAQGVTKAAGIVSELAREWPINHRLVR